MKIECDAEPQQQQQQSCEFMSVSVAVLFRFVRPTVRLCLHWNTQREMLCIGSVLCHFSCWSLASVVFRTCCALPSEWGNFTEFFSNDSHICFDGSIQRMHKHKSLSNEYSMMERFLKIALRQIVSSLLSSSSISGNPQVVRCFWFKNFGVNSLQNEKHQNEKHQNGKHPNLNFTRCVTHWKHWTVSMLWVNCNRFTKIDIKFKPDDYLWNILASCQQSLAAFGERGGNDAAFIRISHSPRWFSYTKMTCRRGLPVEGWDL